jgi:hypothetical protein
LVHEDRGRHLDLVVRITPMPDARADVGHPVTFDMMGVPDTFGASGPPWDLLRAYGLTAEHVAAKARDG